MAYEVKDAGTFECKVDQGKRIIEGFASAFGNVDSHGDVVTRGAFAKTIKERGDRIKVLRGHDDEKPIGLPIEMKEDEFGLFSVSKISETPLGDESLVLAKDGIFDLSIGYVPIKVDFMRMADFDDESEVAGEDVIRLLKEIKLYEYSLVAFPSNEMARITSVKGRSVDDLASLLVALPRMLEKAQLPGNLPGDQKALVVNAANDAFVRIAKAVSDLERFDVQRYVFEGKTQDEAKSWLRENGASEAKLYTYGELVIAGLDNADSFSNLYTKAVEEGISAVGGVKTYHTNDADESIDEAVSELTNSLRQIRTKGTHQEPSNDTDSEPDALKSLTEKIRGLGTTN